MGKTKPIGVRFNKTILDHAKSTYGISSPQKFLNFLSDAYAKQNMEDSCTFKTANMAIAIPKKLVEIKFKEPTPESFDGGKKAGISFDIAEIQVSRTSMPERMIGEDVFDFAMRKNKWKEKYGS